MSCSHDDGRNYASGPTTCEYGTVRVQLLSCPAAIPAGLAFVSLYYQIGRSFVGVLIYLLLLLMSPEKVGAKKCSATILPKARMLRVLVTEFMSSNQMLDLVI